LNRNALPTHALSLIEPWATLMVIGAKRVETRDWRTPFRGSFAIHASKKLEKDVCREEPFGSVLQAHFGRWDFLGMFTLGAIIGCAELLDCQPTEALAPHQSHRELEFGDYGPNRYGFVTDYARRFAEPILARGMLNFWRLSDEQREEIARRLRQ
jgi:hypothetical protein